MRPSAVLLVIATALLSVVEPSAAQPFTQVIVFGDSNVDFGFYKALSDPGGSRPIIRIGPAGVAHGAGAPTSSLGADELAGARCLFRPHRHPSNTMGGTNYATSGAKNVTVNSSQTAGFRNAVLLSPRFRAI